MLQLQTRAIHIPNTKKKGHSYTFRAENKGLIRPHYRIIPYIGSYPLEVHCLLTLVFIYIEYKRSLNEKYVYVFSAAIYLYCKRQK